MKKMKYGYGSSRWQCRHGKWIPAGSSGCLKCADEYYTRMSKIRENASGPCRSCSLDDDHCSICDRK